MPDHKRLFRAIVIMGASLVAPGCDDDRCVRCVPPDPDASVADSGIVKDAPGDAGDDQPRDAAPVDTVLIL